MNKIIDIQGLSKVYAGGFKALDNVDLSVNQGEIFALLGPNGAGKTTMISIVCGITNMTSGKVLVDGDDIVQDFRKTRQVIGLVPQELTNNAFETVWNSVCFTRGLFGKPRNDAYIEDILKRLSLWDKKDNQLITLSGGMKRRVLIAKALSHEPKVLFLDEPSAGVDVELRKDMWSHVLSLKESGVTIILTTHYIEEAEEIADRIGVINGGKIIVVDEKEQLMTKLGTKELTVEMVSGDGDLSDAMERFNLTKDGSLLTFTYDPKKEQSSVEGFLLYLQEKGIHFRDIYTRQSSLEDIFVKLVSES